MSAMPPDATERILSLANEGFPPALNAIAARKRFENTKADATITARRRARREWERATRNALTADQARATVYRVAMRCDQGQHPPTTDRLREAILRGLPGFAGLLSVTQQNGPRATAIAEGPTTKD